MTMTIRRTGGMSSPTRNERRGVGPSRLLSPFWFFGDACGAVGMPLWIGTGLDGSGAFTRIVVGNRRPSPISAAIQPIVLIHCTIDFPQLRLWVAGSLERLDSDFNRKPDGVKMLASFCKLLLAAIQASRICWLLRNVYCRRGLE